MSKLKWDQLGERLAETGVDQGVLYPFATGVYGTGVAWNGLTSVNEAPTGAEPSPFYADNQKYLELMSEEEFAASIGCYTYPDAFKACIGEVELKPGIVISQQSHKMFGFSYRTKIINDTNGVDHAADAVQDGHDASQGQAIGRKVREEVDVAELWPLFCFLLCHGRVLSWM